VSRFLIDNLARDIDSLKLHYRLIIRSTARVYHSANLLVKHVHDANHALGTDGLLAYFEEPPAGEPDALELINQLVDKLNVFMAYPGDITSVSPIRLLFLIRFD